MDFSETIARAQDAISAKRVYGEPYERDGVVVIPAAAIGGGGGGGAGENPESGPGSGGGFGLSARPVGAYVIEEGKVRWESAVDINRLILQVLLAAVGVVFLLRRRRD
jgi:uncharacterized spore protein YtfJ